MYYSACNSSCDHTAGPLELRNSTEVIFHSRVFLYPLSTDHAQKTQPLYRCMAETTQKHVSRVRLRVHWYVSSAGRGADDVENTASSIVACWTLFTGLMSGNALIKSVTISSASSIE
jgi:hypothetical protein